jgi:ribosome maturation factor RimP
VELEKELSELVEREVSGLGYELVKFETFFSGRRRLLRVFIDRSDAIAIEDCVRVTKALGLVLDGFEALPGPYNLEVSSPGDNRPLTKPEHFRRFVGSRARVEFREADGKKATAHGEIVEADADSVTVSVDGAPRRIPYDGIARANLQPERSVAPDRSEGGAGRRRCGQGENF